MALRPTTLVALAALAGLSVACGGTDTQKSPNPASNGGASNGAGGDTSQGGDTTGGGGDGNCPPGTAKMGGACISLVGADPCANPPTTQFDGDSQCLEVPDVTAGMQMHYGPANYDDPNEIAKFVIPPGDELVDCMFMKTPNDIDIHMNNYHVRLRPGTHHMITYTQPGVVADSAAPEPCNQGPGFTFLVGATALNTDITAVGQGNPPPEYVGAAMLIKAHSQAAMQMHFINTTDQPRLKEGWVNALYYPDDQVQLEVNPITWLGGIGMNIQPHTQVVTQGGTSATTEIQGCTVTDAQGPLDIIATVAHMHSHTSRVAAFIQHPGDTERTKFYEDYNWEEPTFVYYNSTTTNQMWDPTTKTTGGFTGDLVANPGDKLSWECEVNNDSDNLTLKFSDLALTGEMCNIFGVYGPALTPWSCISL